MSLDLLDRFIDKVLAYRPQTKDEFLKMQKSMAEKSGLDNTAKNGKNLTIEEQHHND